MGVSRQLMTASAVTFLARFLTFANKEETDEDNDEEVRALAIIPTMLVAAGWSLFTWIGMAHKEDLVRHPDDLEEISDLRRGKRSIAVCTTASVPWLTGTAVNPAIRAMELAKLGHRVCLLVPWLIPEDQPFVFSGRTLFRNPGEQAAYVRQWMRDTVSELGNSAQELPDVRFYIGGYASDVGSIYPLSDIVMALPDGFRLDVLVMEEPEHLTWYYYGDRLCSQFRYVVGVIHTNYVAYALNWDFPVGIFKGGLLWLYNKWCTRTHTHRIIKLSDAMQGFPRQITANVHGVRDKFLEIGASMNPDQFTHDLYFVGKLVWQKGYNRLVPLIKEYYAATGEAPVMEWFGAGDDYQEILETVQRESALRNIVVKGQAVDHSELDEYKVLVNASDSEGLATVTLEALAMGKMVLVPDHPCNGFFKRFHNAYLYRNKNEFIEMLRTCCATSPLKLTSDEKIALSWAGGMERFLDACKTRTTRGPVDDFAANLLARIMPIVGAKVFEKPEYSDFMEDIRQERIARQATSQWQMS